MMNEEIFAGVTWGEVLILLAWLIGGMVVGKLIQILLSGLSKHSRFKEKEIVQVTLKAIGRPVPFLFATLGLYFGLEHFQFSEKALVIKNDSFSVLITIAIGFYNCVHECISSGSIKNKCSCF